MNIVKNIVTGGAYDKPAKTESGAFTKQGEANAVTIEGTSADPNSTGSKAGDLAEKAQQKGQEAKSQADNKSSGSSSGSSTMNQMENKAEAYGRNEVGKEERNLEGDVKRSL